MLFLVATFKKRIQASSNKIIGISITYYDWTSAAQLSTRRVTIYENYY